MKKWCFYGKIFYDAHSEHPYKWPITSYMSIIKFPLVTGALVYITYDRLDIFAMPPFFISGESKVHACLPVRNIQVMIGYTVGYALSDLN